MKEVRIKDTPQGAVNYQLDDGRIYRIILKVLTSEAAFAEADYLDLETVGYEITKDGAFVVDAKFGEPVTLKPQRAKLPLANIRAGLDSAKAGWIKQPLPEDEAAIERAIEGARKLKKLPAEGGEGDRVVIGNELYAWTLGIYDALRRARLNELAPLQSTPAPLPEDQIAGLRP